MVSPAHIVLAEDDALVRSLCCRVLERAGHRVQACSDGDAVMEALERSAFDLALLDWHLPGLSGQALMEAIGWRWPDLPMIMMTGFSNENKAVAAVQYAQAYLRKPVPNHVLLETVAMVLHRSRKRPPSGDPELLSPETGSAPARRTAGRVVINPLCCEAQFDNGPPQSLTVAEYALLSRLVASAGEVVSHRALAAPLTSRTLSAQEAAALCKHHICSLRAKLEPSPSSPRFIVTVRGRGYRLDPEPP